MFNVKGWLIGCCFGMAIYILSLFPDNYPKDTRGELMVEIALCKTKNSMPEVTHCLTRLEDILENKNMGDLE